MESPADPLIWWTMQNSESGLPNKRHELASELQQIHAACFAWARHCCRGDRTEAEEVLQTVYLKILDGRASFDGRSAFKTWVYSVIRVTAGEMRRRLLRRLRTLGHLVSAGHPTVEANGPTNVQEAELRSRVQHLLMSLSNRQREVIGLVFYHELTLEQAAEVMGLSVGSVRVHYERGKAGLRKQMRRYERRYEHTRGRTDKAAIS
jgi:RNA polymerase sigma factor (sigma-70 family)